MIIKIPKNSGGASRPGIILKNKLFYKHIKDWKLYYKMLFWAIRASIPTKFYENKTGCVLFHCASDGNAPGRRNITQKSKNNEKLIFSET